MHHQWALDSFKLNFFYRIVSLDLYSLHFLSSFSILVNFVWNKQKKEQQMQLLKVVCWNKVFFFTPSSDNKKSKFVSFEYSLCTRDIRRRYVFFSCKGPFKLYLRIIVLWKRLPSFPHSSVGVIVMAIYETK